MQSPIREMNFMKIKGLLIALLLLVGASFPQEIFRHLELIEPLRSDRSVVEGIYKLMESGPLSTKYENEAELVEVFYSRGKCEDNGWNVPKDTLISYRVYPKYKVELEESLKSLGVYFQTVDDIFTRYFVSPSKGIAVVADAGEHQLRYIHYFPIGDNAKYRCPGYPPYDLISHFQLRVQSVQIDDPVSWGFNELLSSFHSILQNQGTRLRVVINCSDKALTACGLLAQHSEYIIRDKLGSQFHRVNVVSGRLREKITMEIFEIKSADPFIQPSSPAPFFVLSGEDAASGATKQLSRLSILKHKKDDLIRIFGPPSSEADGEARFETNGGEIYASFSVGNCLGDSADSRWNVGRGTITGIIFYPAEQISPGSLGIDLGRFSRKPVKPDSAIVEYTSQDGAIIIQTLLRKDGSEFVYFVNRRPSFALSSFGCKQNKRSENTSFPQILSASMKFWWWTEEDVRLGVYRDDSPVKSRYLELTKWRYDGDKVATSPHEIDLIGEFANPGPDEFSGKVVFRLSGKYEDYENLYSEELTMDEVTSGEDIFKGLAWKNEKSVYETNLIVAASGHRTVKFPNYDLTGFLNSKFDGKPLAALRFEVEVKSAAGETLSKKQFAVPVILGD